MGISSTNNNNYFQSVPYELKRVIFSSLDVNSINNCRLVCKGWRKPAGEELNKKIDAAVRKEIFGKEKWEKYYGVVGNEPPLPSNIIQILNSKNPYNHIRTIAQDFFLILIPTTLNSHPLDFYKLVDVLGKKAKEGGSFGNLSFPVPAHLTRFEHSYWALVSRDIIAGTKGKCYDDQVELVKRQKGFTDPYLLEIMMAIVAYRAEKGISFYPKETFTRCYDITMCQDPARREHFCVGGYSENFIVALPTFIQEKIGMGVVARLKLPIDKDWKKISIDLRPHFNQRFQTGYSDTSKKRKEPPQ